MHEPEVNVLERRERREREREIGGYILPILQYMVHIRHVVIDFCTALVLKHPQKYVLVGY